MRIPPRDRPKHIYMPGMTQYGKSTLIHHMALHDIRQGYGVTVMDGKGDFLPKFIHYIPRNRVKDTIYLDLDMPVPLDFMGYQDDQEKRLLFTELKYLLLKTIEPQHAPIMNANITDLIHTFLNYNENPKTPDYCRATFLDFFNFLDDSDRRNLILSRVTDKILLRRWKNDFPNPTERSRITTRMTPFVRSDTLAKIFGAKNPKLNIADAIESLKVLLVNLGPPGDEVKSIYGTLLLSKIKQAIYRHTKLPKHKRVRHYLYCDEFQRFQTSDFAEMLSLAGGLGLCLTLAHQYITQLDPSILDAILGNVSTYICFRLGEKSANAVRSLFSSSPAPPPPQTPTQRYRANLTASLAKLQIESSLRLRRYKFGDMPAIDALDEKIAQAKADLEHLPQEEPPSSPLVLPTLQDLQVGQILYRNAAGNTFCLDTPPPPLPPTASYAETIKNLTIQRYTCDAPAECTITEPDGVVASKSDNIGAGSLPNVPSHGGKKKND